MEIRPGRYRHYKGKEYEVVGVAHHSETLERFVVYRALYESDKFGASALWVRPLNMFQGNVDVGGKAIARFARFARIEE